MTSLKDLTLTQTRISDAGMQRLAAALPGCRILRPVVPRTQGLSRFDVDDLAQRSPQGFAFSAARLRRLVNNPTLIE